MALTQYNQFDPKLGPVTGVMQQEPRVFAHDAVAAGVIGRINNTDANHGLAVTNYGSGYAVDDVITLSSPALGGTDATVTVLAVNGTGVITNYTMTNVGSTYALDEAFTQAGVAPAGGTGFAGNVSNIDIPNTQQRGCCIYIGAAAGLATLSVVMESGNTAVFNTISGGTIFPILIKRITTAGLAANDVIALY